MAKKLDTSACSLTNGFPPKQGTWDFLQQAHQEATSAAIQGMIGPSYSATVPYVLYGFVATGGGIGPVTFSSGAVFFNGEIFLFPGQTLPGALAFPTVTLLNIATSQYSTNADPVLFTDGISRNVHNIRTVYIGLGLSGTGDISDFSSIVFLSKMPAFTSTGIVYGSIGGYTASNLGSPAYDVGYAINGNQISLCGAVAVSIPAGGTFTLFTLPVGARPTKQIKINPITTAPGTSGFQVNPAGTITFNETIGAGGGNVYLDGITFRIN